MVTDYQLQMISIPISTDHYQLTAVVTVLGGVEHESYDKHNAFCGYHACPSTQNLSSVIKLHISLA